MSLYLQGFLMAAHENRTARTAITPSARMSETAGAFLYYYMFTTKKENDLENTGSLSIFEAGALQALVL